MKTQTFRLLAMLSFALCANALAASITPNPINASPSLQVTVSGSEFGAWELVDIYFDSTDLALGTTNDKGVFSGVLLTVPSTAVPGGHWITASGRRTGLASQTTLTVHANWPEYRHDAQRSGYNSLENVLSPSTVRNLTLQWATEMEQPYGDDDPYFFSGWPAVVNGTILVGWTDGNTTDGGLRAYRTDTGEQLWSDLIWHGRGASPAVASGIVFWGNFWGLTANNISTGEYVGGIPPASCEECALGAPAVVGNVVYATDVANYLYAYNFQTWQPLWIRLGGFSGAPTIASGRLYSVSTQGIAAVDAASGQSLWNIPCHMGCSEPAVVNGTVYTTSYDGWLHALRATDGRQIWVAPSINGSFSGAAIAKGILYIGDNSSSEPKGVLVAINGTTGKRIWSTTFKAGLSTPQVANGVVYAISSNNVFHAVDASNGHELWRYPIPPTNAGWVPSGPSFAVADGIVYIIAPQKMYAFGLDPNSEPGKAMRAPAEPDPAGLKADFTLMPQ
jgi:outer membrane protein assembly factor BamB